MSSDLTSQKCEACTIDAPKVTKEESVELINTLDNWVIMNDGFDYLEKIFTFDNYEKAVEFSNQVAALADVEDHHPLIILEWGKVTVKWWSHKINGLHKNDFICAQIVGKEGKVIGVDQNPDMLSLSRSASKEVAKNIGFNNTEFLKGSIEKLDELDKDLSPLIADKSVDIILSNCVLNLVSPESRNNLLRNIKRVLNDNGRIAISDIVSNKKVPLRLQNDHDLWTGCISGAWYEPDFISDFKELGFKNLEFAERSAEPWKVIEDIEFRTVTLVGNI